MTEAFARQGSLVAFVDYRRGALAGTDPKDRAGGHCPRPGIARRMSPISRRCRRAIRDAAKAMGDFHVLINNVASDDRHSLMDVTPEYYDARIAVNQRPAFFAIQAVVPGMKKMGGGSIINFGSNSYGAKGRNMSVYTTAKSSVIGLTRGLARRARRTSHPHQCDHAGLDHDAATDRQMAHARRRARDQAQPGAARQGAARRRRAHGAVPGFGRRARLFGAGIHRRRGVVMRACLQYSDGGRTRVARVDDEGAVLPLAGVESTYQLARKAVNERRTLEQVAAAAAVRRADLLRRAAARRPATAATHASGPGALPGERHGAHAPRQRRGARLDARQDRQTGRRAHRLDEDVQVGRGRRQTRGQQAGHATRVVLQGQWPQRGRLWLTRSPRPISPKITAKSPSSWVSTSSTRTASRAASGSPSATNSPTT